MRNKKLVRLRTRPSRDGRSFKYFIDYYFDGKRHQISLGHCDGKKAERQRAQKERQLQVGIMEPESMRLREFVADSLERTGKQIRETTHIEYDNAMRDFIAVVGNINYRDVRHKHGEIFIRACLDNNNRPATVAKKLRHLKRLFQLAVDRDQLDDNPLRRIKQPKVPKKKVQIYSPEECRRILKASVELEEQNFLKWDLLILMALMTAMRKGELLNLVWGDIDFEMMTVEVSPKKNTVLTWEWLIKDSDSRTLPLTEKMVQMLADWQAKQPEGCPYVFVPPRRYEHIQRLRRQGKWCYSDVRNKTIHNFTRHFRKILGFAGVRAGQFHDLRRTSLSNLFASGMTEHDVMTIAGHANFSTTHEFYLAVADDVVGRARQAAEKVLNGDLLRAPFCRSKRKGPANISACQP